MSEYKQKCIRYPYIWAWHYVAGSFEGYIESVIDRAIRECAPVNSVYCSDGVWITIEDVRLCRSYDWVCNLANRLLKSVRM